MFSRYLKASDGLTVVKVSNPKSIPIISSWYSEHGYTEINLDEFKKIRSGLQKKQRVTHGFSYNERELQENLTHLQSQHPK